MNDLGQSFENRKGSMKRKKENMPMFPTNSTLTPSCVVRFPSRTRTVTCPGLQRSRNEGGEDTRAKGRRSRTWPETVSPS